MQRHYKHKLLKIKIENPEINMIQKIYKDAEWKIKCIMYIF